jgi:hypothetical protein
MRLSSGDTAYIALNSGTTGQEYVTPPFNPDLHEQTSDGTVIWASIGIGDVPIGGTPGNVNGSNYFPTDRGQRSIQHLICRARARLRYASRAVTTSFDCSYARGVELTLRKSATLHDPRLPGGLVLGKITGIDMLADNGAFITHVTMQSALGQGVAVEEVPGENTYVTDGYVSNGYQLRLGVVHMLPVVGDVGFSPPTPIPDEDGISFPLTKPMITVSEFFYTGAPNIQSAIASMAKAAQITQQPAHSFDESIQQQTQARLASANSVSSQIQQNPSWYDLVLKPLNGAGAFNHVYHVNCTKLVLPKMIDLQSESNSP